MVLETLGQSLRSTLSKVAKKLFIDEKTINTLVKDIQRALLQADVNVTLVMQLSEQLKEQLKQDAPKGVTKQEYVVKVVYDTLANFLGQGEPPQLTTKPTIFMLVGLFGSGKTTTTGKLAHYYSKRGKKVAVIGLDTHRPAAMNQLEQVANQLQVTCFVDKTNKDPLKIWNSVREKLSTYDVVIVDSAGRDALSKDLITEICSLNDAIQPQHTYLVISADIGQAAQTQASSFHEAVGITGVIITKLDGTARGGGALTACATTKAPISFIGVGEQMDALESFDPKRFVGRLLGMGDIEGLLDKVKGAISEEDAEDLGKRFLSGNYNLIDLYEQMLAMKKMGPLTKVMDLIPGFSQLKLPKEALEVQQGKLEQWRVAMDSFTKQELEDPDIISASRVQRAAQGSGLDTGTIRDLLKQYKQSKKMVKMMKGGDMNKVLKKMMPK